MVISFPLEPVKIDISDSSSLGKFCARFELEKRDFHAAYATKLPSLGGVVGGNLKKSFEVTKIKLVSSKTVNEPEKRPHTNPGLIEYVNRVSLDQVRNLCVFKSTCLTLL